MVLVFQVRPIGERHFQMSIVRTGALAQLIITPLEIYTHLYMYYPQYMGSRLVQINKTIDDYQYLDCLNLSKNGLVLVRGK